MIEFDQYIIDDAIKMLAVNGYEIGEFNPHGVSAWQVQHPIAGTGLCIGECEQDALDNLCDETSYFNMLAIDDNDCIDNACSLGNDGALYNIDDIAMHKVITA